MRWWRRVRNEPAVADDATSCPQPDEARAARVRAEAELMAVRARWPFIRALTESLREIRTENHFAQRIFGDNGKG